MYRFIRLLALGKGVKLQPTSVRMEENDHSVVNTITLALGKALNCIQLNNDPAFGKGMIHDPAFSKRMIQFANNPSCIICYMASELRSLRIALGKALKCIQQFANPSRLM